MKNLTLRTLYMACRNIAPEAVFLFYEWDNIAAFNCEEDDKANKRRIYETTTSAELDAAVERFTVSDDRLTVYLLMAKGVTL